MSPLFTAQLDKERQKILRQLKAFSPNFILGGGTALMLQLGHRLSFDFDCLTLVPIKRTLIRQANEVFGKDIFVRFNNPDMLTFLTGKKVEISFVYHPFLPLKKPISTTTISLFHLDDLIANKAYTIGRRGAWRDYVDLFFALKRGINSLEEIIKNTEKKFKSGFSDRLFLDQLVYFDDLEMTKIEFLKESYSQKEIKNFLEEETRKYLKKVLGK